MYPPRSGDEGAFEKAIQTLVVQALIGANVEQDLRMAAESIERAKKIYEDERQVVDAQLGELDGLHRSGPRMPKLTKIPPSMSVQEFVFGALKAVGGHVVPAGASFFRASLREERRSCSRSTNLPKVVRRHRLGSRQSESTRKEGRILLVWWGSGPSDRSTTCSQLLGKQPACRKSLKSGAPRSVVPDL